MALRALAAAAGLVVVAAACSPGGGRDASATTTTSSAAPSAPSTSAPAPSPAFDEVWSMVPSPSTSCLQVVTDDAALAEHNAEVPVIPASTVKLVVAAAAPEDGRVAAILRDSDNDAARELVDDLGGLEQVLARFPLDERALVLRDATGHDRGNRVTCALLVSILEWRDLRDVLAVSGVSGTLADRFVEHRGEIRAKSGSIRGVAALAGYAGPVTFAMVLNGVDDGEPILDALVDELVLVE